MNGKEWERFIKRADNCLPCPFCGKWPKPYIYHKGTASQIFVLACDCGMAETRNYKNMRGAITAWNKRV